MAYDLVEGLSMCVFVRGEREEKRGGSLFLFAFKERKKEHGGE